MIGRDLLGLARLIDRNTARMHGGPVVFVERTMPMHLTASGCKPQDRPSVFDAVPNPCVPCACHLGYPRQKPPSAGRRSAPIGWCRRILIETDDPTGVRCQKFARRVARKGSIDHCTPDRGCSNAERTASINLSRRPYRVPPSSKMAGSSRRSLPRTFHWLWWSDRMMRSAS